MFDLLVAMDKPSSGLAWLAMRRDQPGNGSERLRQLGLGQIPLTHDAFHGLKPWRSAAHREELLMASGILPAVDKYICSFQRWLPDHLVDIADPENAKTIRFFATWRVLPRLRAQADRGHITPSIRRFAAEQIKYATAFLQWLSKRNTTLASCGQIDKDAWWAENSEHGRNGLRAFLNSAMQSSRCRRLLSIPAMSGRLSESPSRRPFGLPWPTGSQLTYPRLSGGQDPIQAPQVPRPSDDVINRPRGWRSPTAARACSWR
ncbi:hypothetical protein OG609_43620 [Streptomyces sp. NBC_01224]|uniref:hypothetical protein n=1 Tax=Streptomyces sp. NBC_01224 TaxID=2903783 RepID=UPI002E0E46E0|nr:hypothetical protein OG609_43620 [Streptomyces sp. NBC_01224]